MALSKRLSKLKNPDKPQESDEVTLLDLAFDGPAIRTRELRPFRIE